MTFFSYDTYVYHFMLPGVFFLSRLTGACPVTTDLITQVNVRTTTNNTLL